MSNANENQGPTPSNDSRMAVPVPSRRMSLAADLMLHLERRAAEGSAMFRSNVHNVVEELRPIITVARQPDPGSPQPLGPGSSVRLSLPPWFGLNTSNIQSPLSPPSLSETTDRNPIVTGEVRPVATTPITLYVPTQRLSTEPNNDISIDMSLSSPDLNVEPLPQSSGGSSPNESNNNNENQSDDDVLRHNPEIAQLLNFALKYIPFLIILLSKAVFDHIPAILLFLVLFISFRYFNNVVKREVAKQSQRSIGFLLFAIIHMVMSVSIFYYFHGDINLHFGLIFLPPKTQTTISNLLWSIAVDDYILKLITIIFKIIVIMLPIQILPIMKRGKVYLFIEATSQLYRCCVPIQSWLYYMLESYQGPKKIIGVFLSAAYMVSKGTDLMGCVKLWWTASYKLLQNVALGTVPSKEQLSVAGNNCPICHDEYATPVLLQCHHIFCEACVAKWFDREQTCPLCRAKLVDDPAWRDGSTTNFIQLF
ncbi:Zinc finger, RING-type,Zinc finger, RING/FYVE/PHD-type,Zinc finger, RING-type, conserved site [Cinara cedri]|uniref:Zinc finger, RING-type,Zinc finger, RING/FYVE/PHD-type,Zinc finger, RING-type, conserved site n=1 Tax=Cinara cedri TaxID=506608 RepID=A0A5E4MUX8_9HEMI|nr:Zinc finger, RING-type,Zinc finger, RING/FYVE/PHD-type,Zinc finger, RING-type, conserved site [Cinara cedri]